MDFCFRLLPLAACLTLSAGPSSAGETSSASRAPQALRPGDAVTRPVQEDVEGDVDSLAVSSSTPLTLTQFSPPLPVSSRAYIAEIVDLDGDGTLDLVGVETYRYRASFLLGNGDGTFQPETLLELPIPPSHAQAGDLDGDGWLDLVLASVGGAQVAVLYGTSDGTFLPPELVPTTDAGIQYRVALADLNHDDRVDIIVGTRTSIIDVLLNAGNRDLEPARAFPPGLRRPNTIEVEDMDGDGNADLVLGTAIGDGLVAILPGRGDGSFDTPLAESTHSVPVGAVPADIDGDGDLDILATGAFGGSLPLGIAVLRQTASGRFEGERLETHIAPWGLAVVDLNGDGIDDLAAGASVYGPAAGVELFWGSGNGNFVPAGSTPEGFGDVHSTDLDGDGRRDLLVSMPLSGDPYTRIYLNRAEPAGVCTDFDGDGYGVPGDPSCGRGAAPDCDDFDPGISPGVLEICDGVDNDCDGRVDEGFDRDEDGVTTCGGDCDDLSAAVSPWLPEICDGLDNNCDGEVDEEPEASAACGDAYGCTLDRCDVGVCVRDFDECPGHRDGEEHDLFAHPVALGATRGGLEGRALADVTGDGRPDLVEAGAGVAVLPGLGVHGFGPPESLASSTTTAGLAVADLDADGDVDVAVTDRIERIVVLLLNQGQGRFLPGEEIDLAVRPAGLQAADLDGDGLPELAVDLPFSWHWQVLGNLGEARFDEVALLDGRLKDIAWFDDFTRDGLPDVVLAGLPEARFFVNEGGFIFAPPVELATGFAVALDSGDLNGDNRKDLIALNSEAVIGFLGDGRGGFAGVQTPVDLDFCESATLIEMTGDQFPDLLATDCNRGLVRMTGNGDGTFQAPAPVAGGGYHRWISDVDVDEDGCSEAVFSGSAGAGVLRVDGRGGFDSHPRWPFDDAIRDIAIADLDRSGTADIAVLSPEKVHVLLGEGQVAYRRLPPIPLNVDAWRLDLVRVDGDEFPDLIVRHGDRGEDLTAVHLGAGDGTFGPATLLTTGRPILSLAAGDVNADGATDIVMAGDGTFADRVLSTFLGRGDGTFEPALESRASLRVNAIALGEYTGDEFADAVIVDRGNPPRNARILAGTGDGRFDGQAQPFFDLGSGPRYSTSFPELAGADMNTDGIPDVVRLANTGVQVALGRPAGGLHPQIAYPASDVELPWPGSTIHVEDMNEDGALDVVTLNEGGSLVVYAGEGDGTLAPPVGFLAGRFDAAMAVGDLNDDGLPDVVVGETRGGSSLVFLIQGAGVAGGSRLPDRARGRECPPGLRDRGGPPGRGIPPDIIRLPCRFDPPSCARTRPHPRTSQPAVPLRQAAPERRGG